ncbi:MAG: tRNA (adenosine(37)-N6)-threonylcarbamoyltransferase complex dimerization subunit type 1 TsaB [Desulfonatronovibrionaceae bacterium]
MTINNSSISSPGPDSAHLILNCSESRLQTVLGRAGQVIWARDLLVPGRAMKHIAPSIQAGLDFTGLDPAGLEGIACVQGPGSFTGIRMSYAHALGLSLAADLPMASLSLFDALVQAPGSLLHGPVWVIIHSRTRQVYARGYLGPDLKPVSAPVCLNISELSLLLETNRHEKIHVLGSGVRRNPQAFTRKQIHILPVFWDTPTPDTLLSLALKARYGRHIQAPAYLRLSDAEDNLKKSSSSN